jgi:hypothetical protein
MARKFNEIKLRAIDLERLGIQVSFVYADDDETLQQCRDNAQKLADTFFPKPCVRPTHGPCLICGTDTTLLRGDGWWPNVFCCHGPECIPF